MIYLHEDKLKVNKRIIDFLNTKKAYLNIVSIPYNSSVVFLEALLYLFNMNKKVLYITNENEKDIQIINILKANSQFKDYACYRGSDNFGEYSLVITNSYNSSYLDRKFDVVIYDDIRSFPEYSSFEILDIMNNKVNKNGKLIYYGIEPIFKNKMELSIPYRMNKVPMLEPKVINTRIDILKDIPFVVFDYLRWSIKEQRKVIIYVHEKKIMDSIYNCLLKYKDSLTKNIIYYSSNEENIKLLENFMKFESGIVVTDDYKELGIDIKDCDIMVFFADNIKFDYKKLVFLAGKVGRCDYKIRGEVVFLSRDESAAMDKARKIIRDFNKEAWEFGLLKL